MDLTDCLFRKYDRAFSVYEKRTGETHPLALKQRNSNERRSFQVVDNDLTDNANVLWTLDITVGSPGSGFSGQSPFRAVQTPKLITKCVVQLDTSVPDTFLCGTSCLTCFEHKRYNITLSSTAKDLKNQTTLNGFVGQVTGEILSDMISAAGTDVSHDA